MRRNSTYQNRRRTRHDVRKLLSEYDRSGLTQAKFARKHGFGLSTLQPWLRAQRKPKAIGTVAKWVELEIDKPAELNANKGDYRIEIIGHATLHIPTGFNSGEVRELVALLKEGR